MKTNCVPYRYGSFVGALAIFGLQFLLAAFPGVSAPAGTSDFFDWENLQTDVPGVADRTDPKLVNPWGLAKGSGPFWVADNNADASTLYQPDGTPVPLVVSIPQGAPTGIVFNPFTNAFILSEDGQPAAFIFDSENGSITAWNDGLQPITSAVIKFDNSASGAVYKGLALAVRKNSEPTLYAANFNSGNVDAYDNHFAPEKLAGNFKDPNPPKVPQEPLAGRRSMSPASTARFTSLSLLRTS